MGIKLWWAVVRSAMRVRKYLAWIQNTLAWIQTKKVVFRGSKPK